MYMCMCSLGMYICMCTYMCMQNVIRGHCRTRVRPTPAGRSSRTQQPDAAPARSTRTQPPSAAARDMALPNCTNGPCKNVLYFLSDDMRADWGAYGMPTKTPNLDKLASEGLMFTHAYCQMSVCSPSRQSFMTGLRPDRNQVWNFIDANPLSTPATPGHFRAAGYLTLGLGKTFHEDGGAWNAKSYWSPDRPYYTYKANTCPIGGEGGGHCVEQDDKIYDYQLRLAALDYLSFAAEVQRNTSRPFYLMVGFRDPHVPWAAPQRMYDLYDEAEIAGPTHTTLDASQPLIAWSKAHSVQLQASRSANHTHTHLF